MALDSSGTLAISEIVTEFGDDAGGSDSLSEYYGDGANVPDGTTDGDGNAVPESGAIAISDFYDTANYVAMAATGGTVTTSGDYKFHTFTSSGTFAVSSAASGSADATVDYIVVAGGGGGGNI